MQSLFVKEFPVQPADAIDDIYRVVNEDMMKNILEKANHRMPTESEIEFPINL